MDKMIDTIQAADEHWRSSRMRQSREGKARTHEVIIEQAARLFRERGIEQTSVADVMQAAKLTHGGFYKHFQSKDDLAATAVEACFDGIIDELKSQSDILGPRGAVENYAANYLSEGHVSAPGLGCPMAALAIEASHRGGDIAKAFAEGTERMLDELAARLPWAKSSARERAAHMLATLVGAVIMARATNGAEVGREVLTACRQRSGTL